MEICKYSDEYLNHHDVELDKLLSEGNEVGDIFYYDAMRHLDCEHDELRSIGTDDFTSPEEYKEFIDFINDNTEESINFYENSKKSPFSRSGILEEYRVRIGSIVYKVLLASDTGYNWYYFTKEFIDRLAGVTGITVKESLHPVEFIY